MSDERYAEFYEDQPKLFLQSLFDESSTQKQRLGTIRPLTDGREFIYMQAGNANLEVGLLNQAELQDLANHANLAVANAANIGDRIANVTLGDLAAVANEYAEGFLHINANNGEGYTYKIKNHPAANANANLSLTLYDKLRGVNLVASTSNATLTKHPCKEVIVTPSPVTSKVVGATTFVVTANYYAWLQKKGPCSILANANLVEGDVVVASNATSGAVQLAANGTTEAWQVVGCVMANNVNTEYPLIDLDL